MASNEPQSLVDPKSTTVEDDARNSLKEETIEENVSIDETSAAYRKLVHRIDRRLIVTTGFMYCVSLVDRTNIGAANIAGMAVDLGLNVGYRYVSNTLHHVRGQDFPSNSTLCPVA